MHVLIPSAAEFLLLHSKCISRTAATVPAQTLHVLIGLIYTQLLVYEPYAEAINTRSFGMKGESKLLNICHGRKNIMMSVFISFLYFTVFPYSLLSLFSFYYYDHLSFSLSFFVSHLFLQEKCSHWAGGFLYIDLAPRPRHVPSILRLCRPSLSALLRFLMRISIVFGGTW